MLLKIILENFGNWTYHKFYFFLLYSQIPSRTIAHARSSVSVLKFTSDTVGQLKSPESALNIRGDKIGRLKFLAFTLPGALLTLHTTSDRSG